MIFEMTIFMTIYLHLIRKAYIYYLIKSKYIKLCYLTTYLHKIFAQIIIFYYFDIICELEVFLGFVNVCLSI